MWENMTSLFKILGKLIGLPPNQFPIFETTQNGPPSDPSVFTRIVDPPTFESPGPDVAKAEAAELQGAGIYNAMGLIIVTVAALEQADQDHATEDVVESGRMATAVMEQSLSMAPELLLLGLEKLTVSDLGVSELTSQTPLSGIAEEFCDRLWAKYLGGLEPPACTSSTLVFHQLWAQNPQRFWDRLIDFYNEDDTQIGRVVEIGMELDVSQQHLTSGLTIC
jgi:CCR4-NOT transcription complex subunit 1